MLLYLNETSPFSRLVLATAMECGIEEMRLAWTDPWATPDELVQANPFSSIPTLRIDSHTVLYDSSLICTYLIALAPPEMRAMSDLAPGDATSLSRYGQAKTLMDMAFRAVVLERFGGAPAMAERTESALQRGLDLVESSLPSPPASGVISLAELCLAVALDYIAFRLSHLLEATAKPNCHNWLAASMRRSSLRHSAPAALAQRPTSVAQMLRGS